MMYNGISELKSDLRMIGSILEEEKSVHLIGTAAIALITNVRDMCVGDIDTVTDLSQEDTLQVFMSHEAMDLVPVFLEKGLNILNTAHTFKFGKLVITTPELDVLIQSKCIRNDYKDIDFLESYGLI